MDLTGKVTTVTGGGSGAGRAYAAALANAGAAVLKVDLLETERAAAVAAIFAKGREADFRKVDVPNNAAAEAMGQIAANLFENIDMRVNRVTMFASRRGGPMSDVAVERWGRTMAINVNGPWLCTSAVVPIMCQQGGGAIVNQTSISACDILDYTASKAAVTCLTKSTASELGRDNIRVNALGPVGSETERFSQIMGGDMPAAEQRANSTQLIATQIKPEGTTGTCCCSSVKAQRSSPARRSSSMAAHVSWANPA